MRKIIKNHIKLSEIIQDNQYKKIKKVKTAEQLPEQSVVYKVSKI